MSNAARSSKILLWVLQRFFQKKESRKTRWKQGIREVQRPGPKFPPVQLHHLQFLFVFFRHKRNPQHSQKSPKCINCPKNIFGQFLITAWENLVWRMQLVLPVPTRYYTAFSLKGHTEKNQNVLRGAHEIAPPPSGYLTTQYFLGRALPTQGEARTTKKLGDVCPSVRGPLAHTMGICLSTWSAFAWWWRYCCGGGLKGFSSPTTYIQVHDHLLHCRIEKALTSPVPFGQLLNQRQTSLFFAPKE